jgi:hypothetical protein
VVTLAQQRDELGSQVNKRNRQQELRTWILFFVGLGLAYGLYRRGTDPGPYWTVIIGTFVGVGVVIANALDKILGVVREFKEDDRDNKDPSSSEQKRVGEGDVGDSDSVRRKPPGSDNRRNIRRNLFRPIEIEFLCGYQEGTYCVGD